jgi:putative DNA methylase
LFASLVDDPDYDPAYRNLDGSIDYERAGIKRAELFNLIEELVKWKNSNNPAVINKARAEIASCIASRKIELGELKKDTIIHGKRQGEKHPKGPVSGSGVTAWEVVIRTASPEVVNHFLIEYAPPVLDPFAGGGSIPLEAQRLGLKAYASDLNPVAVLINKALIEIPPKFAGKPPVNPISQQNLPGSDCHGAKGLAEDVRYYGQWMRDEAQKRIGNLYPKVKVTKEMTQDRPDLKPYVGEELTVIAWLWARTVASPNPACKGAHVPLVHSFWLSTKKGKEAYVEPVINKENNTYRFEVKFGKPTGEFDPKKGTVVRTGATCLLTNSPMSFEHIRTEGKAGRMRANLMAIVCEGERGRIYLAPLSEHETIAGNAHPNNYPETDIPQQALGFRIQLYGMDKHYKLFTSRQLLALTTFSDLVQEVREKVLADARSAATLSNDDRQLDAGGTGTTAYTDAVATYLAFAIDKAADYWSVLCSWHSSKELIRNTFGRQALPMVWDFAEPNPFQQGTGGFSAEWAGKTLDNLFHGFYGLAKQLDATAAINGVSSPVISTDPPYYDNIGYADLSDFFYIWLRRSIGRIYPQLFATLLTPKVQELIASPYRHGGKKEKAQAFFEEGLGKAFTRMREAHQPDYPLTVYYAFKQAEGDDGDEDENNNGTVVGSTGWETMLSGLIQSGFSIHGTWPMRTELSNRMVGKDTNALASSIVLVCRPRLDVAPLATRREFLQALKKELPEALKNLQWGSIAPVDLAQASIGPGMAVFTRYAKVMESDGSAMTVRTALGLINQSLDDVLAEQEGEFDADSRWALAWFEQNGMMEGPFGMAETLSKAKNTAVNGLVESGIISARGGKVKLVGRNEMPEDWDPAKDKRLTVWEVTQYLIRSLEQKGEQGAAELLARLGGIGETARDLGYRLYSICEKNKWAQEALAYNALVVAWPEITRQSIAPAAKIKAEEKGLFQNE